MKLTEVLPYVVGILAARPEVIAAGIPILSQLDPEYNQKMEAALAAPGVLFVAWLGSGEESAGDETIHALNLDNMVALALVENPKKNTTGKSALAWVELGLTAIKHAGHPTAKGPRPARLVNPAFELGPLNTGLVPYFITFRVKSGNSLATAP